jgi:hypothetical protein
MNWSFFEGFFSSWKPNFVIFRGVRFVHAPFPTKERKSCNFMSSNAAGLKFIVSRLEKEVWLYFTITS